MKHKNLVLLFTGILALIFLVSLISAASTFTVSQNSLSFTELGSKTFTVTNPNATPVTIAFENPTPINGFTFEVSIPEDNKTLAANTSKVITVELVSGDFDSLDFLEEVSVSFDITEEGSDPLIKETINLNVENTEFCSEETNNNIKVTIDNINTLSGYGDDEDFWYPLDEVEIEFQVEYNGDDKDDRLENGDLEWALYTNDGELIIDGEESIKDLDDGDDQVITVTFTLDPDDLDISTESYILYASVTGTEDFDNSDLEDKDVCASDSQDIEVKIDDNFVIVDEESIEFIPETASCGQEVTITADIWNIGSDDQNDVSVRVFIDELNINEQVEIGDIDAFEKETLELTITIPETAEERNYNLRIWVYDEDNDLFKNSEDDLSKSEDNPLAVSGSCQVTPSVAVSASLESGGQAGRELMMKLTITNTGDELRTYNFVLSNYESFASSAELDSNVLAIGAGESKDLLATFDVEKGVSAGAKLFSLDVLSEGQVVLNQLVEVQIQSRESGITGGFINQDNWYLWGIGALNVILVIIIIIVAIRIARS